MPCFRSPAKCFENNLLFLEKRALLVLLFTFNKISGSASVIWNSRPKAAIYATNFSYMEFILQVSQLFCCPMTPWVIHWYPSLASCKGSNFCLKICSHLAGVNRMYFDFNIYTLVLLITHLVIFKKSLQVIKVSRAIFLILNWPQFHRYQLHL